MRDGNFARFFSAQVVSSLGDWIGVIAIAVYAEDLGQETGVGLVMSARVLPGFLIGPLAGVIADRFNRKRTMVVADIARGVLLFSLPFVRNLVYLLVVSAFLESLTLIWGPAKDASLPHFVKRAHLAHANSLSLLAIYGPWPIASVVFASLSFLGAFLGNHVPVMEGLRDNPEALALWIDSITFGFSALMIATLAIPATSTRSGRLDFGTVKRDLVEGLHFVFTHKQVRPWLIGIACTFSAAGGVFSLGVGFVDDVLRGSATSFGVVIGFLATGMIIGLLASGILGRRIKKDVLFPSSLMLLGLSLIAFASMSRLGPAVPIASALGFFGGVAYSTAYSLMQETADDELRGRTFSAAYTVIRMGTLVGLGLFPFVAGAFPDGLSLPVPGGHISLPGTRITLWLAGLVVIGGGTLSLRAIKGRRLDRHGGHDSGFFIAFEGGEGAGKSTQIAALQKWLEARGEDVVVTREPGGTDIGDRIREILLDRSSEDMDPRTETLLYASDRAQHVAEVIAPALEKGKIVLSDRFIDSSLAYQGIARGLGVDEVYDISNWATGGVIPDVVFFLKVDPDAGLSRIDRAIDRLEAEGGAFHERVSVAYRQLAKRFPDRFVVLDGSKPPSELHEEIVGIVDERAGDRLQGVDQSSTQPVPR